MASVSPKRAVLRTALLCAVFLGMVNVGNVVKENISPQLLNALLVIMGSDVDSDNDGVSDLDDAFGRPRESADSDGDGVGDNADAFPRDPTEIRDSDGDGIGNNEDPDDDNDCVDDLLDAFPFDPEESEDTDKDGIGNNADTDDDDDGVEDSDDAFHSTPENGAIPIETVLEIMPIRMTITTPLKTA